MESPYLYKLPAGSRIFRATTIQKEGRWYSLKLEDAYTYGPEITEYSTTKDLKLINITSLTFHYDFMDRLNIMFPGENYDGFDETKFKCLIPLGLLDLYSQKYMVNYFGVDVNPSMEKWTLKHELLNHNLQERNRFSDFYLDDQLSITLEKLYGEYYDGIISPIKWPSKMHGDYFPRELHIFKRGFVKEEEQYTRPIQLGGFLQKNNNTRPIISYDPELAKRTRELMGIGVPCTSSFTPFWNPHTGEVYIDFGFSKTNSTTNKKIDSIPAIVKETVNTMDSSIISEVEPKESEKNRSASKFTKTRKTRKNRKLTSTKN